MATNLIGGAERAVTPSQVPALRRVFSSYDRETLELAITVAIDFVDALDGDPEMEPDGDELDAAWVEWLSMRGAAKCGPNYADFEDAEEDDHPGFVANEDDPFGYRQSNPNHGAGCLISDPGGCQANDDGCGPIYRDGNVYWGSHHDDGDIEDWRQPVTLCNDN